MKYRYLAAAILLSLLISAFAPMHSLKGNWLYAGEFFNGKKNPWNESYKLRRVYDDRHFKAYLLEKGHKPFLYQAGDYQLQTDSCLETETFSSEPSKLTGKTVRYQLAVHKDTLVLKGTLPNGRYVEEYWKREK